RRWEARDDLTDADTLQWRFFSEMVRLIGLRKNLPAFSNGGLKIVPGGNPHLFAYLRRNNSQTILVVNNFSPHPQHMPANLLASLEFGHGALDLISDRLLPAGSALDLGGYGFAWLEPVAEG
ncbi:MAG: alpha-glucosidase C-terminal domain-containing protein, partial [Desulfobacteraceae bacterium]